MKRLPMLWAAGVALLTVTLAVGYIRAAVADDAMNADMNKVADMLEKGDVDGAKKAAKAIADKSDIDEFMQVFRLRAKKGIGIGAKAGVVKPEEDGIEKKV